MGHWNYRVCKETYNKGTDFEEIGFTVREAYYNSDNSMWGLTDGLRGAYGDSVEDLKDGITKMMQAFDRSVVDVDTVVFSSMESDSDDSIDWSKADEPNFLEEFAAQLKKIEDQDNGIFL